MTQHSEKETNSIDRSHLQDNAIKNALLSNEDDFEKIHENSHDSPVNETTVREKKNTCCSCKYSHALKVLIPWRPCRKDNKLPGNTAGLISFLGVSWMTKLMWRAWRKGLSASDLWELHDEDSSEANTKRMEHFWAEEKQEAKNKKRDPNFVNSAWRFVRTRTLICIIFSLILNFLSFLGPSVLVKYTLDYINDPVINNIYGVYIVLAVLGVNVIRAALFNILMIIGMHTAIRLMSGLQGIIYKKMLHLRTGGEKIGAQITNIITNDMERLVETCVSAVFLTVTPVLFTLNMVYGLFVIGPWCLIGFLVYFLAFPIMAVIGKAQSSLRLKTVKETDVRVSLMNEILKSLKLIKMYAWEDSFAKKISDIRYREMKKHKLSSLLQAVSSTIIPGISVLSTMCTLLGYTLSGHYLTSSTAFTIMSMFNSMQYIIGVLPFTIRAVAEARIALQRIQKLLDLPEHFKEGCFLFNNTLAVEIKNANFSWDIYSINLKSPTKKIDKAVKKKTKKDSEDVNGYISSSGDAKTEDRADKSPLIERKSDMESVSVETLFGINFSVTKGKLVGICGSIGSGKSSLLSAICGEMQMRFGELKVDGRMAFVSQQAWIFNSTLRENILIGGDYKEEWYNRVIDVCALKSDFSMFPNGDLSEIGERGINLSGGQKQRVNLARAVYSNRDIYLLDDPLSAVDTKVANHIFYNCIQHFLKGKTVLLVTHGIHFLEKCDEIIFLKNGRICERGTHESLVEREGEYFNLMGHDSAFKQRAMTEEQLIDNKEEEEQSNEEIFAQTTEEGKEVGSVSAKVYLKFMEASGGCCSVSVIFFAIILFCAMRIFNVLWLQIWLDAGDGLEKFRSENVTEYNISYTEDELKGDISENPLAWMYQLVYGLSFIFLVLFGIIKGVGVTFRVLAASSKLHSDMFDSIVHAPMHFLDATPTGRILNRFSRDIDEIDVRIPFYMEFVLQSLFTIGLQIIVVCYLYPMFIIPLSIIAGIFIFVDVFLNSGVRELKRLDSNLKSPVIQHINASMTGLSLIRTFDKEKEFTRRFYTFTDEHSSALLVFRLSNRWFTFRIDVLAVVVMVAITAICVFTKGHTTTAVAGLALASINGVCGFMPFFMRMKNEFVSRITSVERIAEYAYDVEREAPKYIPGTKPPSCWPPKGEIVFQDINLRYRSNLPLVLRGISASIKPCEKIGIVGRTGAGKSSLVSTLLRLIELDSGKIMIDGVDISQIGLYVLRTAISVIPQDPVLFKGTLRYNLDPFDEHSDDALWEALELSHLKKLVQKMNSNLYSEVEASGENFSVGERQLICLTRALLRHSKILLLDEATASVDVETDHLIQQTIQKAFAQCTVLTIAHRLNTVVNYDRIMVLDEGKICEFDSPINLMTRANSLFKEMMKAMGITTVEELQTLS